MHHTTSKATEQTNNNELAMFQPATTITSCRKHDLIFNDFSIFICGLCAHTFGVRFSDH